MIENSQPGFNLWKVLLVLARRKKFIISFVTVCTLGAIIISLVLPKWYRAKTSILPSQHDQVSGITGNFAQFAVSSAGFELPMMATPSDVYATMLKSETIAREIINLYNLQEHYNFGSFQECFYYLKDKSSISVTPEGIVELYYEDKDPEFAAKIANRYISELDKLNRTVKAAKARSDREFIYQRLEATQLTLDSARTALLNFQKDNKTIDLVSQQELVINAASELRSELAVARVTLDVQSKIYSSKHPSIINLSREVKTLEKQLLLLEEGSGENSYLNLPLAEIPRLTIEFNELKARLELQDRVYAMLTELYEDARIKEQKDTPTISILESAYPPELKYKPKRTIIVSLTIFFSVFLSLFIALFADYLERLRRTSPSDFELLKQARNEISGKTGYSDS